MENNRNLVLYRRVTCFNYIINKYNIPIKDLADFLFISPVVLGQVLAGKKKPSDSYIRMIELALGIAPECIVINKETDFLREKYIAEYGKPPQKKELLQYTCKSIKDAIEEKCAEYQNTIDENGFIEHDEPDLYFLGRKAPFSLVRELYNERLIE